MSDWVNIARLTKAKTLEGGLFVRSTEGLPFLLKEGMNVVFVPPVLKVPRTGCVESVEEKGDGVYLVFFSSIDSIDLSEQLVGHYCLVKKTDLPANYDKSAGFDLLGFVLKDMDGTLIGTVVSLEENPAHPLLVVNHEDREVRVPLVDDFLVSLNEEERVIVMNLPSDLLSL